MTVSERFLAIVDDVQGRTAMSQSELERRCKMSAVISNIRSGKVEPSVSSLTKLLTTFPDYSADWVLLGRGDMLRSGGEVAKLKEMNEKLIKLNLRLQERLNDEDR